MSDVSVSLADCNGDEVLLSKVGELAQGAWEAGYQAAFIGCGLCPDENPQEKALLALLRKFAHHRKDCGCFICRNLTAEEQAMLAALGVTYDR